jgi:hypothetical protein
MSAEPGEVGELVEVRLIDLPTRLWAKNQEHIDGVLREFAHIAHSEAQEPGATPARLLALVESVQGRYGRFAAAPRQEISDALSRGRSTVDVTYRVPVDAADAAGALDALLDEADEFCRAGALLSLASPPEVIRYRRWLLREFRRQIAGEPPTPWAEGLG